jgi:diguanylate cyclase (GGDEF)-like protein
MNSTGVPGAFAALGRTLEARTGIGGVAIFANEGGVARLRYANPVFLALAPDAVIPPPSQVASLAALPLRVVPGTLGLQAAACLLQPILGPPSGVGRAPLGAIVLASRRARRCGPRMAAALRDAAEIAGLLIAGEAAPDVAAAAIAAAALPPAQAPESAWVPAAAPARREAPRAAPPPVRPLSGPPTEAPAQAPIEAPPASPRGEILPRMAAHQLIASLLRARSRGQPLAFALVDIDRFRAINEVLGAGAGDAVLAAVGMRIEACLGADDRLIRLENDRYLIVTSPSRRDVRDLADEVLASVARRLDLGKQRLAMRASIGIVLAGRAETSPVRLLMQADTALRRAKAAGGGRVEIHEPGLHEALLERSRLELDLRHAVENRELSLVYQPYIALATGEMSGVEALLRWRHPSRGEIAPGTFIPLAEATGLILPIGMWALKAACAAAAGWPGRFTLSVNISALQFHAPGFVEEVEASIAASGFPPERLELEITETVLMRDNPDTIAQLRAIVRKGIRIALDDFRHRLQRVGVSFSLAASPHQARQVLRAGHRAALHGGADPGDHRAGAGGRDRDHGRGRGAGRPARRRYRARLQPRPGLRHRLPGERSGPALPGDRAGLIGRARAPDPCTTRAHKGGCRC